MTGPEHYREAEKLMAVFYTQPGNAATGPSPASVSRAQVHATLALAAATAIGDHSAWRDAIYGPVTE